MTPDILPKWMYAILMSDTRYLQAIQGRFFAG